MPSSPRRSEQRAGPIERLAAELRSSEAQVLAIDTGRPAEREAVEANLDRARRRREQLEGQRLRWLPQRRDQLEVARREEAAAAAAVGRARVERDHGAVTFVDERELEVRVDRLRTLARDRADERLLGRGRGLER